MKPIRRRGVALVVMILFITFAIPTFLVVFTQIQIGYAEMQRREHRARARLFAQSAIHIYQNSNIEMEAAEEGTILEGQIEGEGRYRIVKVENAPELIDAIGQSDYADHRASCTIRCRIINPPILQPLDLKYRIE